MDALANPAVTHTGGGNAEIFDCFGLHAAQPKVRYIYVGDHRGRYLQSPRGDFVYVGANKGHFDKEVIPPDQHDYTKRLVCIAVVLFILGLIVLYGVKTVANEPPFDCEANLANWEAGWSLLKKDYCCDAVGVGCPKGSGTTVMGPDGVEVPISPRRHFEMPTWLALWMPDLSIGCKFIVTQLLALMIGAFVGAWSLYIWFRYIKAKQHAKTEHEVMDEVNSLLKKSGAPPSEVSVTLMWDTVDDMDLQVTLPDGLGVINSQCKGPIKGVRKDRDALSDKTKLTDKPIENVYWQKELVHWNNKHIVPGDEILSEKTTVEKAKVKWRTLTGCQGFTFNEKDTKLEVHYKKNMTLEDKEGWQAYVVQDELPPRGEYAVKVFCYEKREHRKTAQITIVTTSGQKKEVFHRSIVPGITELEICKFTYNGR